MKNYIFLLLFLGMGIIFTTSCEKYLDKAPEAVLSDAEVFSKLANFKLFFNAVYEGQSTYSGNARDYNIKTASPLYFDYWDQKYTWEGITDAADQGRYMEGHNFKQGSVIGFVDKFTYDGNRRPILKSMFMDIRISNMALKNIHLLQDATEGEINDLKGQAYFIRAYCHFALFRIWGPMPYITTVIGAEDQWDIPRLSKHETCIKIAQDLDTAYSYFELAEKVRRDPKDPLTPGHLADPDQRCPNGVAAKALKARALLYAASPLNTDGAASDWTNAAEAAWEAIQIALANGYALMTPASERYKNFWGVNYTNEQIWAYYTGSRGYNNGDFAALINGVFGNSKTSFSGVGPTQNFVDKYETSFGEALNTQADRDAAALAGHYKEQDPYAGRDPRLALDIITNQSPCQNYASNKAQIWVQYVGGNPTYSELLDQSYLGITRTGYYMRKFWGNASAKNQINTLNTDPILRLAELYLNFAEASNEAYGPTTIGVPGAITAEAAINIIRARVGQIAVLPAYVATKELFRDRIRNERNVELSWEGHYYYDIRRWMVAPEAYSSTLMGVFIEKLVPNPDPVAYPTGYKYTRTALGADRQIAWKPAMYYLPFNTTDNFKMKNFVPNVVW